MPEQRWITVFEGAATKAALLRGLLASQDIECVVPDELTKLADPFITGPNPFQVRLQVREADAPRASELLVSARSAASAGEAPGPGEPGEPGAGQRPVEGEQDNEVDDAPRDAAENALDRRALRTILLTVLIVTAPLALLSFLDYMRECRRRRSRSSLHAGAWLAFGLALAVVSAAVVHLAAPEKKRPWGSLILPEPPRHERPATPIGPR